MRTEYANCLIIGCRITHLRYVSQVLSNQQLYLFFLLLFILWYLSVSLYELVIDWLFKFERGLVRLYWVLWRCCAVGVTLNSQWKFITVHGRSFAIERKTSIDIVRFYFVCFNENPFLSRKRHVCIYKQRIWTLVEPRSSLAIERFCFHVNWGRLDLVREWYWNARQRNTL